MLLSINEWTTKAKNHAAQLNPFADAFVRRKSSKQTHPVHDFLFTYYTFSPQKLKQWVPSFEDTLEVNNQVLQDYPWLVADWFKINGNILSLNLARFQATELTQFIRKLCEQISLRPARFGCFGLHEWAMVYKSKEIRHQGYRLRVLPDELAKFVESQTLCCTHYDAYRFFTEEARPLNILNPVLETRLEMEQGGCVHTNMDIYKWAGKLWPWIGSDFIAKAFFLALDARELDMRASPYDLRDNGFTPICIETEEGRRIYQQEQQQLAEKAAPLRHELHRFCKLLLDDQQIVDVSNPFNHVDLSF